MSDSARVVEHVNTHHRSFFFVDSFFDLPSSLVHSDRGLFSVLCTHQSCTAVAGHAYVLLMKIEFNRSIHSIRNRTQFFHTQQKIIHMEGLYTHASWISAF